jgi:hypothetical protein
MAVLVTLPLLPIFDEFLYNKSQLIEQFLSEEIFEFGLIDVFAEEFCDDGCE